MAKERRNKKKLKKMKTVHEVSRFTGVSVRTLHHYDAIGLLKPAEVTEAGYRLYDDAALGRLQIILMFRELRFPLKEIKKIMESPDFDRKEALAQQIRLLELQREHIGGLIAFAREIQEKGVEKMNFDAFWNEEVEQYAEEVRERWGTADAYKEFEERRKEKGGEDCQAARKEMRTLFAELGAFRGRQPSEEEVQERVKALQDFITENFYHCTDEILSGLGEMYVSDERMKQNIDRAGGDGTAEFAREAIRIYCGG